MSRSIGMLALCAALAAVGLQPTSPSGALQQWRSTRLLKWSRHLDRRFDRDVLKRGKVVASSRYHTKILVVDSDGASARVIEAILDRVAESCDIPVDAIAATLGSGIADGAVPSPLICEFGTKLGLSSYALESSTVRLQPRALIKSSRHDLIICTDSAVLERVRPLARAANAIERAGGALPSTVDDDSEEVLLQWSSHPSGEGADVPVLCITDFLAAPSKVLTAAASEIELPEPLMRLIASNDFDLLQVRSVLAHDSRLVPLASCLQDRLHLR